MDHALVDMGDIDIHLFGEQRIDFDHRAKAVQFCGRAVVDKENDMRIADIDRCRILQVLPADRHGERVHGIGEGDGLPVEPRLAHIDNGAIGRSLANDDAAAGFDPGLVPDQPGDAPRCIAARFDLAAVGVEDLHPDIHAFCESVPWS